MRNAEYGNRFEWLSPVVVHGILVAASAATLFGYFEHYDWLRLLGITVLVLGFLVEKSAMVERSMSPAPIIEIIAAVIAKQWIDSWWEAIYVGYAVLTAANSALAMLRLMDATE